MASLVPRPLFSVLFVVAERGGWIFVGRFVQISRFWESLVSYGYDSFAWSKPIVIFRAGAQILQVIYRRQSEIIGNNFT